MGPRCDRFTEFKHVRDATEKYVGIETMKNIYGVHVLSEEEELKAQFALTHYRQWHKEELWRALKWYHKAQYLLVDGPRETLASIGVVAAPYGGYRAGMALYSKRREARNMIKKAIEKKTTL